MNAQLAKIWFNPNRTPVLIGVIAFNAGIGLGYILGKRRVISNIEEQDKQIELDFDVSSLKKELDNVRDLSVTVPKVMDNQRIVAKKVKERVIEHIPPVVEPEELVTRSVFDNNDEWDYAKEVANRTPDAPYIIHKDEFYSEEAEYTQNTFTYYAGDNILVDEDDKPVYNHDQVVGPLLFGHGSGDPNVVHIRNDKRKAEYEVCFDPGLYTVEVLGLEIEDNQRVKDLKHSKVPKFRQE